MVEVTTALFSVEILASAGVAQVCWLNQVVVDGSVKSEIPHRCSYDSDRKAEFIADLENPANGGTIGLAVPYIQALRW